MSFKLQLVLCYTVIRWNQTWTFYVHHHIWWQKGALMLWGWVFFFFLVDGSGAFIIFFFYFIIILLSVRMFQLKTWLPLPWGSDLAINCCVIFNKTMSHTDFQINTELIKELHQCCALTISVKVKLWSELKREVHMHKHKNTVCRHLKCFEGVAQYSLMCLQPC